MTRSGSGRSGLLATTAGGLEEAEEGIRRGGMDGGHQGLMQRCDAGERAFAGSDFSDPRAMFEYAIQRRDEIAWWHRIEIVECER
jgi:hypothetical protein